MSKEFTARALRGLNPNSEPRWAETSGVVRGSDDTAPPDDELRRYACCKCEFMVEMTAREVAEAMAARGLARGTVKDPITDKGWVSQEELVVRERFLELAKPKGCAHFEKRMAYAIRSLAHNVFGEIALLKPARKP